MDNLDRVSHLGPAIGGPVGARLHGLRRDDILSMNNMSIDMMNFANARNVGIGGAL